MEGLERICCFLILLFVSVLGDDVGLPAYEYYTRFREELKIGECPNKLESFQTRNYVKECKHSVRNGTTMIKNKTVNGRQLINLEGPEDLFKIIVLCDRTAASDLGLLVRKDCTANEIAKKLSFKSKHVTRLRQDYLKVRSELLKPDDLNIPDSFTNMIEDYYYTKQLDIGIEEVVIVDMQFVTHDAAEKAKNSNWKKDSLYNGLMDIRRKVGDPRKIKVIRLSTAEKVLETKVFKGAGAIQAAMNHIKRIERQIIILRQKLQRKLIEPHLKYVFSKYEVPKPIALPLTGNRDGVNGPSESENWKDVSLLQVETDRVYITYKRFRKICRNDNTASVQKCCRPILKDLERIKKAKVEIHTQRRDWNKINPDVQTLYVQKKTLYVKGLKMDLRHWTKSLKRILRTKRKNI